MKLNVKLTPTDVEWLKSIFDRQEETTLDDCERNKIPEKETKALMDEFYSLRKKLLGE